MLLHADARTQKRFYTQTRLLLHTATFTHKHVYRQAPLHTEAFSHTDAFTHGRVCTHTHTLFLHRGFYTQTFSHTHTRFYTQRLLHTNTFTQRCHCTQRRFYTQPLLYTDSFTLTLLHTRAFAHKCFYTRRFCTQKRWNTNALTQLYKACTKYFPVLLRTTRRAPSCCFLWGLPPISRSLEKELVLGTHSCELQNLSSQRTKFQLVTTTYI